MKTNHQSIDMLQTDNELLAAVVRSSADAVLSTTPDGLITTWNLAAENLLGYKAADVIGKHTFIMVPDDKIAEAAQVINDIVSGKRVDHFIARLVKKDGSGIKVSVSLSPIKGSDNIVAGVACIVRNTVSTCKTMPTDIGEINEMLEQKVAERTLELQEANKALEAFSYSVSHDLKSPVRAICSFTKIIHKDHSEKLSPDVLSLLSHIESNSRRMSNIIEDLLALAKHSRCAPQLGPVDLGQMFRTVWDNMQLAAPSQAKLELAELPIVYADASMLEQVVVNLLSNAAKYSSRSQNPLISVGVHTIDGNLSFYVKDNGAGFDMQYYHRLFGVFERLHNLSDFEGTGIGLFLVKRIIEKHGGTIWANAKINEGATFYFTLPKSILNN